MPSPEHPQVAVVVVCWNLWADTRECLASLRAAGYPRLSVIVVDNGSGDGTAGRVAAEFPEVELLANAENLGFCEGNNRGIERALASGADYVMLLNNDTIVEPGFVQPLVDALAADDRAGFASPVIVYADEPERTWFGGGEIDWRTAWAPHARVTPTAVAETPTTTGCCLLAPRAVWEEVGLLDPRYFLFWEDTDWSVRVGRAGRVGLVVPSSRVRHKVSRSLGGGVSPLGTFYFVRNGLLFAREHAPRPLSAAARFTLLWAVRPTLREARRRERGWLRLAVLRAGAVAAHLMRSYGRAPRYALWLARASR